LLASDVKARKTSNPVRRNAGEKSSESADRIRARAREIVKSPRSIGFCLGVPPDREGPQCHILTRKRKHRLQAAGLKLLQ